MSHTPIARPPFDVDDKNVQYAQPIPQQSRNNIDRQARNKASESTHEAYDDYLAPSNDRPGHRASPSRDRDSAHGAIGGGLLTALDDSDYSDSDSEEDAQVVSRTTATRAPVATAPKEAAKSKNQALFEAATRGDEAPTPTASANVNNHVMSTNRNPSPAPPAYEEVDGRSSQEKRRNGEGTSNSSSSRPQAAAQRQQGQGVAQHQHRPSPPNLHPDGHKNRRPSPAPSITPPPAAPLQVHIPAHQMNAPQPQRPIPHAAHGPPPPQMQVPRGPPAALTIDTSRGPPPSNWNNGPYPGPPRPMMGPGVPFGKPVGFHMTPTEIPNDSASPIVPAFIKPAFIKFEDGEKTPSVMSHDSTLPILRGEKEDYLPVRSGPGVGRRPPKLGQTQMNKDGDDFWRRFSMVAKREKTMSMKDKRSTWLKSTQRGTNALNRWTWCIGIVMLILVIGGSVACWWFTRSNSAHAIPVAIGGGASETMGAATTIPTPVGAGPTATAAKTTKKARQATPTTPPAKRSVDDYVSGPAPTAAFRRGKRHQVPAPTAI